MPLDKPLGIEVVCCGLFASLEESGTILFKEAIFFRVSDSSKLNQETDDLNATSRRYLFFQSFEVSVGPHFTHTHTHVKRIFPLDSYLRHRNFIQTAFT